MNKRPLFAFIATLLLVAARNCRPGDVVSLRQVTAKCGEVRQEARWPFGMSEAESLTRPAAALFAGLAQDGARRVRRSVRDLGRLGKLLLDHERAAEAPHPLSAARWRDGSGRLRGVRLRWRSETVGLAWEPPSRRR